MAAAPPGQFSLVQSLATLLRNNGDVVMDGSSTLTLPACTLQQLIRLFEQYLLSRSQQHGFLALPSHPADTSSLLQLQFLFDVLQKTLSLKLIHPPGVRLESAVKIFPFKSLKCLELKRIPAHLLEGLRGVYSQLEVFTCSKSLDSLEELLSLCGGDLSSALTWLELHTLNFSYNAIVCLDQSLSLLNVLKSLDLSHNKIQECGEFLKPLSELEHLNLGYNCLQRAPTLGPSARAKLHTLILRNNELETINGVEQLSSLQHLDLAYNLLLEHAQLAPLSLLHGLTSLNLEGNPLYFQKSHRSCTVPHLSPKAVSLRMRLDGIPLSSSELSVLPKAGQLIIQVQTSVAPTCDPPERSNQEPSSGAGDLSDSLTAAEVGMSRFRKKKSRSKVKVRRASISEPSDTDHEPRPFSSAQDVVLPHQQEIERMSSFRDQLGEDWLRYQHHLDGGAPTTISSPSIPQTLTNGVSTSMTPSHQAPAVEVLPLLSPEPNDPETDSTLKWLSPNAQQTDSTLETSTMDGPVGKQEAADSHQSSPESQRSARASSGATYPEEEDEIGVDLCRPLLVGILPNREEADGEGQEGKRMEVFLRVKQGVLVEVDPQRGVEMSRLELDSLARVQTTQAIWTPQDAAEPLPAVELHFDYIAKSKRRRTYLLLDDDPHQAAQVLSDILSAVLEENQRRDSKSSSGSSRLQCLRCRSEFSSHLAVGEEEDGGSGVGVMLRDGEGGQSREEQTEADHNNGSSGAVCVCPECGSDHVVQVAHQAAPCSSTPISGSPRLGHELQPLDFPPEQLDEAQRVGSSLLLHSAATSPEQSFVTAQGTSFFIGDAPDRTDSQGKEELAGSYHYSVSSAAPPQAQPPAEPAPPSIPKGDLDLLSEDYESVDHRLQLFLDVEVFEEEEELHSFLKMSAVKYGEPGEVPSLLVVSNQRFYFLEMTSDMHVAFPPSRGPLTDWLQKKDSYPIMELSYLEVGLGSQSIHMEFADGGVAYTLLVRDSVRCKRFFGLLTGMVREMAHKSDSRLQSISTTRLSAQHHLWPLVCEDIQADVEDGQLQFFYILAFVRREELWLPQTVLATRETLYLLDEDHQWRKSVLAAPEDGRPCSGSAVVLETLPISCVSSVLLWASDPLRMDTKLYDETVKQEKTWCVRTESAELLQGLLSWVRAQWEAMFGVKLHMSLQDEPS
ncbi:serine/threonine-protein kinase 11-interacting protein isoform X2 [Poeciliopsis prolifica]|uniref:serine/threonine-protein kinase 11-interacting protein isoform X2 n=1 Tax=Poeciliopsis prolifica TaxID=188132 RepID=UPI002414231E|nr:serine/threonine-protein kinase 11-interacting protein isoform X2 [Poeciliopsis prolifica]